MCIPRSVPSKDQKAGVFIYHNSPRMTKECCQQHQTPVLEGWPILDQANHSSAWGSLHREAEVWLLEPGSCLYAQKLPTITAGRLPVDWGNMGRGLQHLWQYLKHEFWNVSNWMLPRFSLQGPDMKKWSISHSCYWYLQLHFPISFLCTQIGKTSTLINVIVNFLYFNPRVGKLFCRKLTQSHRLVLFPNLWSPASVRCSVLHGFIWCLLLAFPSIIHNICLNCHNLTVSLSYLIMPPTL